MKVIATHGATRVVSPKFKTSKKAFAWATPFYLGGYKITIVEKKRKKYK